jgi:hypothetical protein
VFARSVAIIFGDGAFEFFAFGFFGLLRLFGQSDLLLKESGKYGKAFVGRAGPAYNRPGEY